MGRRDDITAQFQSTLPAWGETYNHDEGRKAPHHFNPLSPHGERRDDITAQNGRKTFQSTLPAWGETRWITRAGKCQRDFNPLSPHGERPIQHLRLSKRDGHFNPLSPHGERPLRAEVHRGHGDFNPLSPHGERPERPAEEPEEKISIHSPRMGRDTARTLPSCAPQNFNPLSPHGERPLALGPPDKSQEISIHSPRMGRD